MELSADVLVTSLNEILDVLNHLEHRATFVKRLRRYLWPIAVVNAIVPPLEDRTKPFLESLVRRLPRLLFIGVGDG
jgi:hypothetical protein